MTAPADDLRARVIAMAEQHDRDHDLGSSINAERLALAVAAMVAEECRQICADGLWPVDIDEWMRMSKREHGAFVGQRCADAISKLAETLK